MENNEETRVAVAAEQQNTPPTAANLTTNFVANLEEQRQWANYLYRQAEVWSNSAVVPQMYQGNRSNAFVAVDMAARMGVSPLMVMQNLYVVKNKPSWSGQACIMLINSCGKFRDVKPVYTGTKGTDSRGCYFSAVRISDGEKVEGTEITLNMAKAEGWTANSKWRNMPEQMLAYRAAAFFARVYCPEALMGMQTAEEVQDITSGGAAELTAALKGGAGSE